MDSSCSRSILSWVIFMLAVSPVVAINCNDLSGQIWADCLPLNGSNNKVGNLIYNNHSYPDHEFVLKYNKNQTLFKLTENSSLNSPLHI